MTAFLSAMPALRSGRASGKTAVCAFEPTTTNHSRNQLHANIFHDRLQEFEELRAFLWKKFGLGQFVGECRRALSVASDAALRFSTDTEWALACRNGSGCEIEIQRGVLLGAGVGAVVDRGQLGGGELGVALRGREALVAKQLLNGTQVSALFEQMGSECVAQGVRVDVRR